MFAVIPSTRRAFAVLLLAAATAGCGGDAAESGDGFGVSAVAPANNATAVPLDSSVSATFSAPVDPATLDATTFSVSLAGLTPIAGSIAVQGEIATFTPLAQLAPGTTFTSRVKGGAAGVKDFAGTPLPVDFVWQWTTAGALNDLTPPTVVSTVPIDGTSLVCTGQTISALFSEAMDPLTINSTTFTLAPTVLPGAPVAGAVAFDPATRTATFTPSALLQGPGVRFTARIAGGVNGVKDLAGNPLAFDRAWTFETGGLCP